MLHYQDRAVRDKLFDGLLGLEKEALRITPEGYFAQTSHPFPEDPNIVRDFCENQTEINTDPLPTPKEAVESLLFHTRRIRRTLSALPQPELLWTFSNPPYIRGEQDIPIAQYYGKEAEKTTYREYLAERYGRYKMTFSGIHFNYSFADELLRADFALSEETDFAVYKDRFYVKLAAKVQSYNWLVVAITAASPLLDSSYIEKGDCGKDVFNGMGTTRCSELGYWNFFTPVLDYTDIRRYSDSIEHYIREGLIRSSSELYFPVRLKPPGVYSLAGLRENGVSHIELRMIDLNPLTEAGIDERDVAFLQLLLVYLACIDDVVLDANHQILSIANTKNAARYDLKTIRMTDAQGNTESMVAVALRVLSEMKGFFYDDKEAGALIDYQIAKFAERENRYAWQVRKRFEGGFVEKGLVWIREQSAV